MGNCNCTDCMAFRDYVQKSLAIPPTRPIMEKKEESMNVHTIPSHRIRRVIEAIIQHHESPLVYDEIVERLFRMLETDAIDSVSTSGCGKEIK